MDEKTYKFESGQLNISNEVLSIISAIAATEVKGVAAMSGNITNDIIHKLGIKTLSKGVSVNVQNDVVSIQLSLIIQNNFNIPEVSSKVQDRVRTAIENMTGMFVEEVSIKIAGICE